MADSGLLLPLPQSVEHARSCALLGVACSEGRIGAAGAERLVWRAQARQVWGLGAVRLISRGPVAAEEDLLQDWLAGLRGGPMLLNAEGLGAEALRAAGFWPLLTPATLALLDLGPAAAMRARLAQKWRNRLNRAEGLGLVIRRMPLARGHWLLAAEAAQARARGYRGLPPAYLEAFAAANPGRALIWQAEQRQKPVAAVAVLRHGPMATWQCGVTLPEGRACHAMTLLLWSAMVWLAERGHTTLDLGILDSEAAAGLARFKLGTGPVPHRLGGTWLRAQALVPLARRLPLRMAGGGGRREKAGAACAAPAQVSR
ncbi:MAG: GNAT family N-acetyltransferase [Salipiger marinus]|uniref:GNAT family N-acetyltransferase n=1 Tax=Salipiger marinus TaxID=555512 RepID=UPI004058F751